MRSRRSSSGFTLVEVMVSLLMSALVVLGAFGIFASQRPAFQHQLQIQNSQQGLQLAMELIQRDFHRAGMGFGFCSRKVNGLLYQAQVDCFPQGASSLQVLRAVDMTDGGPNGTDSLTLAFAIPPSDGAPDSTITVAVPDAFATPWTSSVDDAHDFLSPLGCTCPGGCSFAGSTYALLYRPVVTDPPKPCALVQVTAATCNASANVTWTGRPTFACTPALSGTTPSSDFGNGDQLVNLGALARVTYSIDSTDPATPRLVRDANDGSGPQVVAYDIEDLQVVVACDTTHTGAAITAEGSPSPQSDEWFYNVAGDTVPSDCTTYPKARVTLVARSILPDPTFTIGARPALENHVAGAADQYHRRIQAVVMTAPNVGLQ